MSALTLPSCVLAEKLARCGTRRPRSTRSSVWRGERVAECLRRSARWEQLSAETKSAVGGLPRSPLAQ
ncbi:unnamed protein product [Lampetra planeri]